MFFEKNLRDVHVHTSELFFWLLIAQWVLAIAIALVLSPYGWAGRTRSLHTHVELAVVLGGLVNALPLVLLRARPDGWLTRHTVAVVQMLWSAILIHITGGRIETHFHVFVSLAFLAFYRDWRLLVTASVVVVADHLARGALWPASVYGIANPEWWRFLEHAGWVAFEDVVLIVGCFRKIADMKIVADGEAALAVMNDDVERLVDSRTAELELANASLAREMDSRLLAEAERRQAQKLEAVGRLASGIAHEINTPVQFVSDSIQFVSDAAKDLFQLVDTLVAVRRAVEAGEPAESAAAEATAAEEVADLAYLTENVPQALRRALEGLDRVTTIVRAMKTFAHPDRKDMAMVDLNLAVESTLIIARNEYKYVADLEMDLGKLPPVECHAGDVNQAILNVVVNAAHSIADVVRGTGGMGRLTVRTRLEGDNVIISIRDTGTGIPAHVRDRVFEPFFTTKGVGQGTGQGLAIAHKVVTEMHGGGLSFETEVGVGTVFHISLPVTHARPQRVAA
jgi:signal transduction histidine kinase